MGKQLIVALCREYGSQGHEIAKRLSEKLDIKLYDRALLDQLVESHGFDKEILEMVDEKPIPIFTKRLMGHSSSIEEIIAEKIFECQRELADSGESFVIVGRCSDYILKDYPGFISVFVTGDYDTKLTHVMQEYHIDAKTAIEKMTRHDKKRRLYHNSHSSTKWGDSRSYDIVVNSSILGVDKTVDILYDFIKAYWEKE